VAADAGGARDDAREAGRGTDRDRKTATGDSEHDGSPFKNVERTGDVTANCRPAGLSVTAAATLTRKTRRRTTPPRWPDPHLAFSVASVRLSRDPLPD